jgi:hypothetical protein
VAGWIGEMLKASRPEATRWADGLLSRAVELDDGRPGDDITVVVVTILEGRGDDVRRLSLRMAL